MATPKANLRQLLEAGVHFGHQKHRWNPRMAPYIFGVRNGIHIMDLSQTVGFFNRALETVRETVAGGGRILFVGTKRQASGAIADAAQRCGQYYVNHRWLGGMLTNWQTISQSIKTLKQLTERLDSDLAGLTKKEILKMTRQRDKLNLSLGGIQDMGGLPDLIFVIDTNRETNAIAEANNLNIPVIGILDSNSSPEGIDLPVPGNDDAARAINLYCDLIAEAVLDGIQADLASQGVDLGEAEEVSVEAAVVEETAAPVAEEATEGAEADAVEPAAEAKTEVVVEKKPAKKVAAKKPAAKKKAAAKKPAAKKKAAAKKPAAKKAAADKPADDAATE